MDTQVSGWIDKIITTLITGFNKGLEFFGLYTSKYAGWIVGLVAMYLAARIFNIKVNIGGSGRKG